MTRPFSLAIVPVVIVLLLIMVTTGWTEGKKKVQWEDILPEYVNKPDATYSFELTTTSSNALATSYIIKQTSFKWLTPEEVGDRFTWINYVIVTVPNNLNKKLKEASLYIDSGYNFGPAPSEADPLLLNWAVSTRTVTVGVYQIPNQPITYASDPTHATRIEDAIIAFGWKRFGQTLNPEYVTQLPMVKASKLAMDTTISFLKKKIDCEVEKFTIVGASKRGWAAWLLAGVDRRVKSVIPLVIPVLNTAAVFKRTYNDICAWPPAMADYIAAGLPNDINSPGFSNLVQIIDPLVYNHRLSKIPKYQVLSLGDEFFSSELNTLGYKYLKGEKYVRYIPNTGHSLDNSDAVPVMLTYQLARLNKIPLPKYKFSHEFIKDGIIIRLKITNRISPTKVRLWSATNPKSRDFRTYVIGNSWQPTELHEIEPFEWKVLIRNPPSGYTAMTVEMEFDNFVPIAGTAPLKLTTNAYITPNKIPCNTY